MASDGAGSGGRGRLHVTLVTADRPLYDGQADSAVVPGYDDGEVGFLPGHAAYMAILGYGVMKVTEPGGRVLRFAVYGGFVQVVHDHVTVLANRAQAAAEISSQQIETDRKELAAIQVRDEESFQRKSNKMREGLARRRAAKSTG